MPRRAWLTPNAPINSETVDRMVTVSLSFLEQISGAIGLLSEENNWEQFGTLTPAECAEYCYDVYLNWLEWSNPMIGSVIPYATNTLPPNCLPCDGATYLNADYPALAAIISDDLKLSPTTFRTPNMNGRLAGGAGAPYGANIGRSSGTNSVTVLAANMPAHSHGYNWFNNTYKVTQDASGVQVPRASATYTEQTGAAGSGTPLTVAPTAVQFLWGMVFR